MSETYVIEKINPITLNIVKLSSDDGISQSVSQLVSRSVSHSVGQSVGQLVNQSVNENSINKIPCLELLQVILILCLFLTNQYIVML